MNAGPVANTLRPDRKVAAFKYGIVSGLFLTIFNGLVVAADQVHELEPLAEALERHFDLPQAVFDIVLDGLIALVTLSVCLFATRMIERYLRGRARARIVGGSHAGHAGLLEAHADSTSRTINRDTVARFAKFGWIPVLLQILTLQHSVATLVHWSGPVGAFVSRVWPSIAFMLVAWGCMVASSRFWLARLRNIDLPDDDEPGVGAGLDDSKLHFRRVAEDPFDATQAKAQRDIQQLARTETYGDMGSTNIAQVFDWWLAYPSGNWLAVYDDTVVGGIDIWPLKKSVYDGLRAGRLGEEHIERESLALRPRAKSGSYWYVASISLAMGLRKQSVRKAVIARLAETMLEENFLPSVSVYPARVIALIWTPQGENIAKRAGFSYVGERKSEAHADSEPIWEIDFRDEASTRALARRIRERRLSAAARSLPQPPVENPG